MDGEFQSMGMNTNDKVEDGFLQTRVSLLGRLRNHEDHESWRDFFETYWRLIYSFAKRAGLSDQDAQEVVQETVISVAGTMPQFHYDPARCSFKGWLRHLTQKRIVDQFRKRPREQLVNDLLPPEAGDGDGLDLLAAPGDPQLEQVWQTEWEENLKAAALARLQKQVSAEHFQIYVLHVIQQKPAGEVRALLGTNAAKIYVVKHRLAAKMREIVKHLEQHPI